MHVGALPMRMSSGSGAHACGCAADARARRTSGLASIANRLDHVVQHSVSCVHDLLQQVLIVRAGGRPASVSYQLSATPAPTMHAPHRQAGFRDPAASEPICRSHC